MNTHPLLIDGLRVGLLGGSFNPAHAGHLHLSMEALKRLKLDRIIWLVSPQNPLKSPEGMTDYASRLAYAAQMAAPFQPIHVSDFEWQQDLRYSADTVAALQHHYPRTHFVWLMGADNLANFHRWHRWQSMFESIPIAIFDRAPFAHAALRTPAALRYHASRCDEARAARIVTAATPAWVYCFMKRHPLSATQLRKTLGDQSFIVA